MSHLPAIPRSAIELTYFGGQSQNAAAHTMGISSVAVAEQIGRGLVQLQRDRAAADPR